MIDSQSPYLLGVLFVHVLRAAIGWWILHYSCTSLLLHMLEFSHIVYFPWPFFFFFHFVHLLHKVGAIVFFCSLMFDLIVLYILRLVLWFSTFSFCNFFVTLCLLIICLPLPLRIVSCHSALPCSNKIWLPAWTASVVEGLNVIKDPKCNKVLNVITFCPKCNNILS